jgi:hypothetical protein
MKKIIFSTLFYFLIVLNVSAFDTTIENKVNYNSQSEVIISVLEEYISKFTDDKKNIIIDTLIPRIDILLEDDISEDKKYIFQEIKDTYQAKKLYNSSNEYVLVSRVID